MSPPPIAASAAWHRSYGSIGDKLVASVKGNVSVDLMHRETTHHRALLLRHEMDR